MGPGAGRVLQAVRLPTEGQAVLRVTAVSAVPSS